MGWIPAQIEHRVKISGALSGWGVLLIPEVCDDLPQTPCVMGISDLLRALVKRAANWPVTDKLAPEQQRLIAVLLDEIKQVPVEPLHLPLPDDKRLLRIAYQLIEHPADNRTLAQLSVWAGLSERTARRLFLNETGLSFIRWRQQARLVLALERLADGKPVAFVADALGYATPSNFIAMFKQAFGTSPARYINRQPE